MSHRHIWDDYYVFPSLIADYYVSPSMMGDYSVSPALMETIMSLRH